MNDTQLRMYALQNAREIIGAAPLEDILAAAEEIYAFLTDRREPETTRH